MKTLTLNNFFETQYKEYSNYDNERSIPNLIDGLKITQRKILNTCVIKNIVKEYKVAQLASLTACEMAYHHGEVSVGGVVCTLAQTFVGSNNINLLSPIGQFGSRLNPVPAAHRYIFTHLSPNFRKYFKKDDDIILEYLYDDDTKIEPNYFIPILPGILLNSSEGIGTGFASKILARNPKEISDYIKAKLSGKKKKIALLPYFNGFKGSVELVGENKYQICGVIQSINSTTIKITELPVGMYLDDIKKQLNKLVESEFIKDYTDNSTEDGFDIDVYLPRATISSLSEFELMEKLKLVTTITENLTCWLDTGKLRKFNSASEIIDYFIEFRLNKYSERITKLLEVYDIDIFTMKEKIRFINFYLANTQKFKNARKLELLELLDENSFDTSLLSMQMWSLTGDKISEITEQLQNAIKERDELAATTNIQIYTKELEKL